MPTHLTDDPSIPSVGQQIGIEGYTIVVAARCQCSAGGSLVPLTITCSASGTVAQPNVCPKCRLGYAINDMKLDGQGRLSFGFAVMSQKALTDS